MDIFNNLILGLSVASASMNLLYCLFGVLIGTLVGVLPGIGVVATVAMLLPLTFKLTPVGGLIMLAGIYYGAQYGCSTTAILLNIPGESSSVVTCLDGNAMARQGRAGPALATAALGSFFAGCVATVFIFLFAPFLSEVALKFGPAEYFSLMLLGLVAAVVLASASLLKAFAMVFLGLLMGLVGTDVNSGMRRFCFGLSELSDGIGFVVVAMGLFGFAEIISSLEHKGKRQVIPFSLKALIPTRNDLKASWRPVLRGTGLGSFLGMLPGAGVTISSFGAYSSEKRLAADPSRFGQGAIERVEKRGKAWVYRSTVSARAMMKKEIRKFLDVAFDGAAASLVAQLADMKEVTLEDLREIERQIDRDKPDREKGHRGEGGRDAD